MFIPETICNPGLRERHWDQMGEELGFKVNHLRLIPLPLSLGLDGIRTRL